MQTIGRSARMARHHKRHREATINLVSMIDMMTILVFFLLVHGGFIRLAVLELNLPSATSEPRVETPAFELEITVREAAIEIGDRSTGLLSRVEKKDAGYDFAALTEYLRRLKQQFPEKEEATVLVEPQIAYDVVVAVMDRVRVAEERDATLNRVNRVELFPQVSVGDAPL